VIVCNCKAVSEKVVKATMDAGARSVSQVAQACGAGTQCGACVCDLRRLLAERRARKPSTVRLLATAAGVVS